MELVDFNLFFKKKTNFSKEDIVEFYEGLDKANNVMACISLGSFLVLFLIGGLLELFGVNVFHIMFGFIFMSFGIIYNCAGLSEALLENEKHTSDIMSSQVLVTLLDNPQISASRKRMIMSMVSENKLRFVLKLKPSEATEYEVKKFIKKYLD